VHTLVNLVLTEYRVANRRPSQASSGCLLAIHSKGFGEVVVGASGEHNLACIHVLIHHRSGLSLDSPKPLVRMRAVMSKSPA